MVVMELSLCLAMSKNQSKQERNSKRARNCLWLVSKSSIATSVFGGGAGYSFLAMASLPGVRVWPPWPLVKGVFLFEGLGREVGMQYNTTQYNTRQYITIEYSTIINYGAVFYCVVWCCIVL